MARADSPYTGLGFKEGDVLEKINAAQVRGAADVRDSLFLPKLYPATFYIRRGGTSHAIQVVIK